MSFYPALLQILAGIHTHFQLDELAYLAVTSKIEYPLRDRVAFGLHQKFGQELLVHREWKDPNNKKADIAITDLNNKVQCLIECKAHSAPTYEKGYSRLTKEDLSKMFHSSEKDTELYFLFFFNHVHSPTAIEPKFRFAIKYWQLLNNALALFKYQPDLTDQVQTHWHRHLEDVGLGKDKTQAFSLAAGHYYGMPVHIHAHLYGPVFRDQLNEILK